MRKSDNKELVISDIGVIVPNLKEAVDKYIEPMKKFVYVRSIEPDKINGIKVKYTLVNSEYFIPDDFREYEQYIENAVRKCTLYYDKGIKVI